MFKIFLLQSPFLKLLVPFILGIWLANEYLNVCQWSVMVTLFLFFFYGGFVWWHSQKPVYARGFWSGVLSAVFLISFGISFYVLRAPFVIDSDDAAGLEVEICSWMGETAKSNTYEVCLLSVDSLSSDDVKGAKGLIYVSKKHSGKRLRPGDELYVNGRFLSYSKPLVPYQFDYSKYLKNNRVAFRMIVYQMQKQQPQDKKMGLMVRLARFKEYVYSRFADNGIGEEELAVLNAMFLGDKNQLSHEQKDAFVGAGAMHLLAVSGLHVGIIYLLLSFFFNRLLKNEVMVFIAVFLLLWTYALLTGFSASVLRATIMFSVIEIGKLAGRRVNMVNLLSVSMFIILLIDPLYLFSVGFWLSHCAVASIVFFYPFFDRLFYFSFPPFRWLWSVLGLSVTAQLGVLPISLMVFHQFPVMFIVANWLLIPVVTPILLLSIAGLILSPFTTVLQVLLPALNDLLGFMNDVVSLLNQLPYSSLKSIPFTWWQMALLFACLLVFGHSLELKTIKSLKRLLLMIICFLLGLHFHRFTMPVESLVCIATDKGTVVNYFNPLVNEVYASPLLKEQDVGYIWSGMWSTYGVSHDFDFYQTCNQPDSILTIKGISGKNIMFVRDEVVFASESDSVKLDYVIDMRKKYLKQTGLLVVPNVLTLDGNEHCARLVVQEFLWSKSLVFIGDLVSVD